MSFYPTGPQTPDTAESISLIWNTTVSHQTVLKILDISGDVARDLNKGLDLSPVQTGLLDEVFQKSTPLLVFADAASGAICVEEAPDRSGDSWEIFLTDLKKMGLDPETLATDGGSGLLKGIREVFTLVTLVRDLFHVLKKMSKATTVMENTCYRILAKSYTLAEKGDVKGAEVEMAQFDKAATIFDLYEKQLKDFMLSSYLAHPESHKGYVSSDNLHEIIVSLKDSLDQFREDYCEHRR